MASLNLEQLNKVYNPGKHGVHAVDNVSLFAESGEIIGLLGSSGCGKTSTLRMIAGFESITSGTVKLGDRTLNGVAPGRRGVAMAFEGYALYPPLTVYDNIAFAIRGQKGFSAGEVRKQVNYIAELLEIDNILDRKPLGLSGGQAQRVSLCRALLRHPEVYLLDEPMSQLEPRLRAQLRVRVKEYLVNRGVTSVFVTHDQTEAMALADRVAVMEGGVLQQYGTPFELESRPNNLFVGSFIGEPPMNILQARVGSAELGVYLAIHSDDQDEAFGFTLPETVLTPAMKQTLTVGRELHLGIRAHSMAFCEADEPGAIPVSVVTNQWLGDQAHLALTTAGRQLICVTSEPVGLSANDNAFIRLPPEHLHIFDSETTEALFHGSTEHDSAGQSVA
ncbi:ABC transporter ATP-binding protein [Salinisphaera orenii]|uniref:ABC transporter ATP-binding protein n=1 Tax=Salinisphaera orenii TaxID=856731 RepID=UPI000DBE574F